MTLFQVKPEQPSEKPDKTQIDLTKATTKGKLPCQEKQLFFGSKKKKIASCHQFSKKKKNKELYMNKEKTQDLENLHFIANAIRSMLLDKVECLPTWAACKSLVSKAQTPVTHVGFLPYLPYPVTEYSTVYTTLCNFLKIETQLNQLFLPAICDEVVFCIVADNVLQRP